MRDKKSPVFGKHLKDLRKRHKESLAEVSGAVEIDVMTLSEIEDGKKMPSEDILLLLISHFSLRDDEAMKLWRLAGFDKALPGQSETTADGTGQAMNGGDSRILYTDMVHVNANNYGVIINFLQGLGSDGKPTAVARVGMSREHALSIISVLQKTLQLSEKKGKQRPATDTK